MNGADARAYLRGRRHGVLSTLSQRPSIAGHPYGSLVPFMTDHDAAPVFLISALAEHTKNALADPRASLTVFDGAAADVQSGARLTLTGEIAPVRDAESMQSRYLRYVPTAERLLGLGDFAFFRLLPRAMNLIAGFGAIHWFTAADVAPPANTLADAEEGILAHMNADHAHNLRDYCRLVHGREVADPVMIGIDCDGFDVRAEHDVLRFAFAAPVIDAGGARQALVAMARA
jgi:putative heme iron utilization protein